MAEKKVSEQVIDAAIELEQKPIKGVDLAEIKRKVDILLDYAIKIEEYEIANGYYDKYRQENELEIEKTKKEAMDLINGIIEKVEIPQTGENGFRQPTEADLDGGSMSQPIVFENMNLGEKVETRDTISSHLKRALELLVEKGQEKMKSAQNFVAGMPEMVSNAYNSHIEYKAEKKKEHEAKLAAKKEEKRTIKEQAIKQLKALGKEDIEGYREERDAIEEDLEQSYEAQEAIEGSMKSIKKNTKALTKYEKKGFFSRLISNFSELGKEEGLSDEQKKDIIENGGAPKKIGFFNKLKQAFIKTNEQGKEIKGKNEQLEQEIMKEYERRLEEKNKEISELENVLAENDEKREELEAEKKEKIIEIVKSGKLKVKDLQEMIDNEILLCSNPHMIVAQARVSTLKDKLSRVLSWGKEKGVEKETPKSKEELEIENLRIIIPNNSTRNTGMDR